MNVSKFRLNIKNWFVPITISLGLFIFIRPALAQFGEEQQSVSDFLAENNVEVGIEVVNGFSKVFYIYKGDKIYVSREGQNAKQVSAHGEYVVWVSEENDQPGQIILYKIPNGTEIQLTLSGNNANPKVSRDGKVVWEGWVIDGGNPPSQSFGEASWQIFLFDGMKVTQLTNGDLSVNPDIEGDSIVYSRRDITGTWRSVVYSISRNETKEISTGVASKHPKVKNGKIFLADGVEEFPLTIEDLFVLDLPSLTGEEVSPIQNPDEESVLKTVTEEEVIDELSATASAILEEALEPEDAD